MEPARSRPRGLRPMGSCLATDQKKMDGNMRYMPTPVDGGETTAIVNKLACAALAGNRVQADSYRRVLEENGIEVTLGEEFRMVRGDAVSGVTIPVLVSETCQELATELIALFEVTGADWDGEDDGVIGDSDDLDDDEQDDDDDFLDDDIDFDDDEDDFVDDDESDL